MIGCQLLNYIPKLDVMSWEILFLPMSTFEEFRESKQLAAMSENCRLQSIVVLR